MTGSIRLPIADIAIEEVECRPSRQFRIAGELILSAIVVRAPADNGDGVLAGALGDLTEKVVALCAITRVFWSVITAHAPD